MASPTLMDRIRSKFSKYYLYLGQTAIVEGKVYGGIMHKVPEVKLGWKVMDHQYFLSGSQFKYLGTYGHQTRDIPANSSIFEIIHPVIDVDPLKPSHISPGDVVCIAKSDRKSILPYRPK